MAATFYTQEDAIVMAHEIQDLRRALSREQTLVNMLIRLNESDRKKSDEMKKQLLANISRLRKALGVMWRKRNKQQGDNDHA